MQHIVHRISDTVVTMQMPAKHVEKQLLRTARKRIPPKKGSKPEETRRYKIRKRVKEQLPSQHDEIKGHRGELIFDTSEYESVSYIYIYTSINLPSYIPATTQLSLDFNLQTILYCVCTVYSAIGMLLSFLGHDIAIQYQCLCYKLLQNYEYLIHNGIVLSRTHMLDLFFKLIYVFHRQLNEIHIALIFLQL